MAILNDAKFVIFKPHGVGSAYVVDSFSDKDKADFVSSSTPYNPYLNYDEETIRYIQSLKRFPIHLTRKKFNDMLNWNRDDFFISASVRNPWCQSLHFARWAIDKRKLNISFSLDYKQEINDIIQDMYINHSYRDMITSLQHHYFLIDPRNNALDYDFIVYFEDMQHDVTQLSDLCPLELNKAPEIRFKNNSYDYREYYTPQIADLIAREREKDCQLFGYDFDKIVIEKNNRPKIKSLN